MNTKKTIPQTLLLFFLVQSISSTDDCSPMFCSPTGPQVRFPFRLVDRQLSKCGFPGFDLSCNKKNQTVLKLPSNRSYVVKHISYGSQMIDIEPNFCGPEKLTVTTLTNTPFDFSSSDAYTFYNCSTHGYAMDRMRMSLPDFDLSGFSNKDTAPPKAQNVLACALFSEIVKSLGVKFDLSPRQKAVFECLRAPHAQNFLTVTPIEGLGLHMSALEYRTILKYRLMIPLFPTDEPCPVCRKVCLDSFGEHAVHCKELPGFKYRHDLVRDVLYDVLKRAGISSKKEAPVNFLTDPLEGRSTLRPADILVFGWAGAKHACVDLTGVSPLVGLRDNGFVAGQAALKAESSKVAKHEKACLENQHVFIPFAFDTFGLLAPEAEKFLSRVQRVVQSNFATLKKQNFIFSRIGFAIQKGVAAQLVARLPAIVL